MKSLKLYLILFSGLIIIYLIAEFNRPKAVDWSETFNIADKAPFGDYILYNRINDIFPGAKIETFREPPYNVINDYGIKHGTYLIISGTVNFNEYDYEKLITFIKRGNDVFISASDFGDEFSKELKIETSVEIHGLSTSSGLKFTNKYIDTGKTYRLGKNITNSFFNKFDTAKAVVLGLNRFKHVNFLKYTFKKGNLYVDANPLVFTNYSLLNKNGNEYAATALSYLKKDSVLIWDQYYARGREGDSSSMRVFLRNRILRWSFYITFFSLLFYVLYEIKRRQRIIPVIEPLKNSTLEFVTVVGQVYYEKRNNANMAKKKITYLLEHLRDGHQIKTNTLDDDFIKKLTSKLAIEPNFARELVEYIRYIKVQENVTDRELIELNKLIEKLYIQAS